MNKKLIKVVLTTILVFAMNVTAFAAGSAIAVVIDEAKGITKDCIEAKDGVIIKSVEPDITNPEALKALESEAKDINERLEKNDLGIVNNFKMDVRAQGSGCIVIYLGEQYAKKIAIVSHYNTKEGYWTRQILKISDAGEISPSFENFSPIYITIVDYDGDISEFRKTTGIFQTEKGVETKDNGTGSVVDKDNKNDTSKGNSGGGSIDIPSPSKGATYTQSSGNKSSGSATRSVITTGGGGGKGKGKSPNTNDGYGVVWLLSGIIICSALTMVSLKKEK
ncbi:hypothetical protein [Lachnobacterium bovis]|uniref:hypothetical protein n=1 Tax=Lachnobacterium bovis TaxID=140626 RepID=UPI00048F4A84|nr:hypothetical protein [Lachnobacterium bovis]